MPADGTTTRLLWAPAADGRKLDGACWPHSRDAVTGLSALIPLVGEHLGGPVTRVSANIDAWGPDQPRRLEIGDVMVRLGWFHTLDASTVTFARGSHDRVTLAVVPPELDATAGAQLLQRLSASKRWPDTAEATLAE